MNVDTPSGGDSRPQFPSPEWSMIVEGSPGPDGAVSWHASIFRSTTFVCRVALSGNFESDADAEAALAVRVHKWLTEYEGRLTAEVSGFHILSGEL